MPLPETFLPDAAEAPEGFIPDSLPDSFVPQSPEEELLELRAAPPAGLGRGLIEYGKDVLRGIKPAWQRGAVNAQAAAALDRFDLEKLAQSQQDAQSLTEQSQPLLEFNQAKGFSNSVKAFLRDPLGIGTELTVESFGALLPTMVRVAPKRAATGMAIGAGGGAAVGGIGAAPGAVIGASAGFAVGMGRASYELEYTGKFLEVLQQAGVKTDDPASLKAAFANPELVARANQIAHAKALPIAVLDATSAVTGGTVLTQPAKTALRKAGQAGAEAAVQGALGGGGEALGQISAGEPLDWAAILGEVVAEPFGSAGEVAVGAARELALAPKRTARPDAGTRPPPATPRGPLVDEFGGDTLPATPPPSGQGEAVKTPVMQSGEAVLPPESTETTKPAETEAERFAREQRETMAAMRQAKDLDEAVEQVRQDILRRGKTVTTDEHGLTRMEEGEQPFSLAPEEEAAFQSAKRNHGTTERVEEAGYVLPDGTLVDFSGRGEAVGYERKGEFKFGPKPGQPDYLAGNRQVDHREIEFEGRPTREGSNDAAMERFQQMGAIRTGQGLIDMARPPSAAQWRRIREIVEHFNGAITLDLRDNQRQAGQWWPEGTSFAKIQGQIRRFYAGNEIRQGEQFSMAPESAADQATQARSEATQKIVDEAAAGARVQVVAEGRALPGNLQIKFIQGWNRARALKGQAPLTFTEASEMLNRVQGTVLPDGTVVLNAAAPGMNDPAQVQAKLRHELAHVALLSAEGRRLQQRLVGRLTQQQRAELVRLGYSNFLNLEPEAYHTWLANEFIARQAELDTAWWQRFVQHVRDWLAGRKGLKDITNEEVARAILRALQRPRQASNGTVYGPAEFSLTAHHGTPHEVEKFRLDKIGTGEGAQVYGWGLYFAENATVAEQYAKNVGAGPLTSGYSKVSIEGKEIPDQLSYLAISLRTIKADPWPELAKANILQDLEWRLKNKTLYVDEPARRNLAQDIEALRNLDLAKVKIHEGGNEYTVELDVTPEELLDWDKPLSEQSEKVRGALSQALNKRPQMTGSELYRVIAKHPDMARAASETLLEKGIRGIRYLDQGSRSRALTMKSVAEEGGWIAYDSVDGKTYGRFATETEAKKFADEYERRSRTYNYVIFDESAIRISHKNGTPVSPAEAPAFSLAMDEGTDTPQMRQQAQRIFADPNTPEAVKAALRNVRFQPQSLAEWRAWAQHILEHSSEEAVHRELVKSGLDSTDDPVTIALQAELADRYARTEADPQADPARKEEAIRKLAELLEAGLGPSTSTARKMNAFKLLAKSPAATTRHLKREFMARASKAWDTAVGNGNVDNLSEAVRTALDETREAAMQSPEGQQAAAAAVDAALEQQAVTPGTDLQLALRQQVLDDLVKAGLISEREAEIYRLHLDGGGGGTLADKLRSAGILTHDARARAINDLYKARTERERANIRTRAQRERRQQDPADDTTLDQAIRRALAANRTTLGRLVRDSARMQAQTGQNLAARLQSELGLSGNAAARFVAAFNRRWQALLDAARDRTVNRLALKGKLDRLARGELWRNLAQDANLGVLTDDRFRAALKTRYGVAEWTPEMGVEVTRRVLEMGRTPEGIARDRKVHDLYRYLRLHQRNTRLDYARELFYSDLFFRTSPWIKNVVFNAGLGPALLARDLVVRPGAFLPALRAGRHGAVQGLRDAASILGTGEVTGLRLQKFDTAKAFESWRNSQNGLKRFLGNYLGIPFRVLAAGDVPFYRAWQEYESAILAHEYGKQQGWSRDRIRQHVADVLDYGPEHRQAAQAQAIQEGFSPTPATGNAAQRTLARNEYWRRVDEIIQQQRAERFPELAAESVKAGLTRTLNSDFSHTPLGWLGSKISEAKAQSWGAWIDPIFPVVRVIINGADQAVDWTPGANWLRAVPLAVKGTYRGAEASRLDAQRFMASVALSHVVLVGLALWSASGGDDDEPEFRLHGAGPRDAAKRKQMPEGWRPHSIQIGKSYFPVLLAGPLAPLLDMVANYQDADRYGELEKKDALHRFWFAFSQLPRVFIDQAGLQAIADLLEMTKQSSDKAVRTALTRLARTATSTVLPGYVNELDALFDAKKYTSLDVEQALLAGVPFARRSGSPDLDWRGQPMHNTPWNQILSREKPDALGRELLKLGLWAAPPRGGLDLWPGVDATPAEQYEFAKQRQQRIYAYLDAARKPGARNHHVWQTLERSAAAKGKPFALPPRLLADPIRAEILTAIAKNKNDKQAQAILNALSEAIGKQVKAKLQKRRLNP